MDEFNNNGGQGYDPNLYGQPSQSFNDQPNGATQFGGPENTYGGQPQYNQYDPNMNAPQEKKGFSITSLTLGILSFTCCCGYVGILFGVLAIILGLIGMKKGGRGMAIGGLICGIIGLLLSLIISFLILTGEFTFDIQAFN